MATRPKMKPIQGMEIPDEVFVDPVSGEKDFKSLFSDEAFMNEMVTITVHTSTDENQAPYALVNCNGMNMPFLRGVPTTCKRKYVEILARMKETKYRQELANPSDPTSTVLIPRTGLCFPFDLVEDRNPKGRAWLTQVMSEQA